jgi:hypothetical protein
MRVDTAYSLLSVTYSLLSVTLTGICHELGPALGAGMGEETLLCKLLWQCALGVLGATTVESSDIQSSTVCPSFAVPLKCILSTTH